MPRASVIIPNFNNGRASSRDGSRDFLGALLESLERTLAHDPTDLEIVIGDDGSTDDSLETARQWSRRTWATGTVRAGRPIVRLLEFPHSGVLSKVLNAIHAGSESEFVCRLDGDVVLETPNWVARCVELLEGASGAQVHGWLSPRGTPSANTPRLLAEAGFVWYGDVFDQDLPYIQQAGGKTIVAIPLNTDVNDMPFMKYGAPPRQMLDSFMQNLEVADASGETCVIDVTNHAHIFGRPRGAYFYAQIMAEAVRSGAWIATRAQVAAHVLAQSAA